LTLAKCVDNSASAEDNYLLKEKYMEKLIRLSIFVISFVLIAILVQTVTMRKFSALEDKEAMASAEIVTAKDRERQLDCLAKNVYHEAGGEPFEGKVAVAQVTINRSESGRFPKDICGVVYQKNIFMEKVVCQFSWHCQNGGKAIIKNKAVYNESYEVAKKVLLEGFRLDTMKKAMYFHADYVNPGWGKPVAGKIGRHIFYKE
jgi:spore germination cell wall hydrolase CwlJ-like protein